MPHYILIFTVEFVLLAAMPLRLHHQHISIFNLNLYILLAIPWDIDFEDVSIRRFNPIEKSRRTRKASINRRTQ
uniref:Putative ovule protein n=1 Tax=Solanum chacoense TaxID=4108 RepID=A0A0V0GFU3_SOLCH